MDSTTRSTNEDETETDYDIDSEYTSFPSIERIESCDETYRRYYGNYKKTNSSITKFEKAKIIGIRAQMIADGSEPLIPVKNMTNSLEIAEEEYKQKKIPLLICRNIDSKMKEYWRLEDFVNIL